MYALADQSTTTTLLWDPAPKKTTFLDRTATQLVWLDITDELTDTVVHWAPIPAAGATSITPTQSMSIGDVKGVVVASERYAVIGVNDGGYVIVDRNESTVTTAQLPSGTTPFAPEYVGTTPLSPHEEAWVREATNMYRLRLGP